MNTAILVLASLTNVPAAPQSSSVEELLVRLPITVDEGGWSGPGARKTMPWPNCSRH